MLTGTLKNYVSGAVGWGTALRDGRTRVRFPIGKLEFSRVPAANASWCTTLEGLLYKSWSLVFSTYTASDPSSERRNYLDEKWPMNVAWKCPASKWHSGNLRHRINGFTSLPKEGVLRIVSPRKIRRLRPGSNPRTWAAKASTLPLDHRNREGVYNAMKWWEIITEFGRKTW